MKNLMVANRQKHGRWSKPYMQPVVSAQVENALELGWKPEDILLVANFGFKRDGVNAIRTGLLNTTCLTGSKMWALKLVHEMKAFKETIWAHDLDCWQIEPFDEPEFSDVGICRYSTSKLNGGSVFWKPSGWDIASTVLGLLEAGEAREEPALNKVLNSKKYRKRVTVLNSTYNVGCSGFVPRYLSADKPVRACHLNPYNRIAWETHRLDRNGVGIVAVSARLEKLLRRHFNHLAYEISDEGLSRREHHKRNALGKYPDKFACCGNEEERRSEDDCIY